MRVCNEVWYVQGADPEGRTEFFDTKMGAEQYARAVFPDEDVDKRYGRIFYHPVHSEGGARDKSETTPLTRISEMRKVLEEVQFQVWPDSVILTDEQMFRAMQSEPAYLSSLTPETWDPDNWYSDNDVERRIMFAKYKDRETAQQQLLWARAAFMNRSDYPEGFFYACGRQDDGTYKYVGFRCGVEASEYMSGYSGLTYKPV